MTAVGEDVLDLAVGDVAFTVNGSGLAETAIADAALTVRAPEG